MSAPTKPDLGGGLSHPARFSAALMPIMQAAVPPELYPKVLDPFAGTGRIHDLVNETVGVEIEPEWAALHPDTIVGNALALDFADGTFDAVVTSPCYGNRYADHHNARDGSVRRGYTHDLGRPLTPGNAGALQWGDEYRDLHREAWGEADRVLRPGGRLVLNIKDHIRRGVRQPVTAWHAETIMALGFTLRSRSEVSTPSLRQGVNGDLRCVEQVLVFDRPAAGA